jgi:calmodulin-regulated spectrin-associated protein
MLRLVVPLCPSGPKLFKEPSSKSNKPIIFNAISHCCLAGKVNEPQKNTLLEVKLYLTVKCY